jgi:hypothetical protein
MVVVHGYLDWFFSKRIEKNYGQYRPGDGSHVKMAFFRIHGTLPSPDVSACS